MSWEIQTNDPGKFDAEISYVSSGMSWQADYNLVVSDKPGSKFDVLDMVGWVTMHNQSGKTFENATIKLLAGDVNKIQEGGIGGRVYAAAKMAADEAAMAPVVREKSFDEFHLYTLQRPDHLARPANQAGGIRARHQHSRRSGFTSMTAPRPINTATTTRSRSATNRTMARSRIPKYG